MILRKILLHPLVLSIVILLIFSSAQANWSLNIGSQNPHTSSVGINFMNLWANWAIEAGLGYIDVENSEDEESGLHLGGGVNGKYLFFSGLFRPYVQVGLGMSAGVSGDGAGAGASGLFGGGGLFINDSAFYIYTSYNLSEGGRGHFFQGGIGFHL